jgi:hypothetical protein
LLLNIKKNRDSQIDETKIGKMMYYAELSDRNWLLAPLSAGIFPTTITIEKCSPRGSMTNHVASTKWCSFVPKQEKELPSLKKKEIS